MCVMDNDPDMQRALAASAAAARQERLKTRPSSAPPPHAPSVGSSSSSSRATAPAGTPTAIDQALENIAKLQVDDETKMKLAQLVLDGDQQQTQRKFSQATAIAGGRAPQPRPNRTENVAWSDTAGARIPFTAPAFFLQNGYEHGIHYNYHRAGGGGSCFFRAVCLLLDSRGERAYKDLRRLAATLLTEQDWIDHQTWDEVDRDPKRVNNLASWKTEVARCSGETHYYADHVVIRAVGRYLAQVFNTGLVILRTDNPYIDCPHVPEENSCVDKFVFLVRTNDSEHYDAVRIIMDGEERSAIHWTQLPDDLRDVFEVECKMTYKRCTRNYDREDIQAMGGILGDPVGWLLGLGT